MLAVLTLAQGPAWAPSGRPRVMEWRGPSGPGRAIGGNMTMSAAADYLSGGGVARRLVIDKTGLTGE